MSLWDWWRRKKSRPTDLAICRCGHSAADHDARGTCWHFDVITGCDCREYSGPPRDSASTPTLP